MSRQYGDCFQASLVSAEELKIMKDSIEQSMPEGAKYKEIYDGLGLSESIYVVHGTAVPPDGLDKGRTINHAWIEVGSHVIETSNNQRMRISTNDYYVNHGISPIKRYAVTEARDLTNKHGRYGAWHLIEDQAINPPDATGEKNKGTDT
jgi:hypothetical protein